MLESFMAWCIVLILACIGVGYIAFAFAAWRLPWLPARIFGFILCAACGAFSLASVCYLVTH